MIYAGVDIAKMDHVIGAVDEAGAEAAKPMGFKNSEAGFEKCVAWLESVAESEDEVFVGMEATGTTGRPASPTSWPQATGSASSTPCRSTRCAGSRA